MGHATVLIELGGVRLLTDPLLRGWLGHLRRHHPAPSPDLVRRIDAVLVSHLHFDHLDVRSLRRLDRDVQLLVPPGAGAFLRRRGFPNVAELGPGETVTVGPLEVATTPAVHNGRRRPLGVEADAVGFEVRGHGRRAYFAGDTELFPEMAALAGGLDVALLPVWGWGPTLGPGHLNPAAAAEAAALLRPRLAIPIHWGTFFPRGLARRRASLLSEPPREFAARVAELTPEVEVQVLEPGSSTEFPLAGARAPP